MSLGRIGKSEPTPREDYEKRGSAGSKSEPHCPECGAIFDLAELAMVEQMEATDGTLLCKDCKKIA